MALLDSIRRPSDLKKLSLPELTELCAEIRKRILETVSANGGHLASNLGDVELTVALESVFSGENDRILWDVGHQAYAHKLLTGRADRFSTLRRTGGLSGFLSPDESPYDMFRSGHAGVAVSEAIGLASARETLGTPGEVLAVVGDGALGCGISLEALNSIRDNRKNFIIVVNDNKMSISRSVGGVSRYLNRIITGRRYNRVKTSVKVFLRHFPFGRPVIQSIRRLEAAVKSLFVSGIAFEDLGIKYVGPLNGHNLRELIDKFTKVRELSVRPIVVHVITEKGLGAEYAVRAPERYHGVSAFDPATGKAKKTSAPDFSTVFAKKLSELAERDPRICAVTAAMATGTKLSVFAEKFPERFHDVGMAEEHAVVFAGGLARGGMKPVVAIYAAFLQRALDCICHDVCFQNLPVVICADRAGAVADGPSHHGIFDLPFELAMPGLTILAPRDGSELCAMLEYALSLSSPCMIRYPRGSAADLEGPRAPLEPGRAEELKSGSQAAFWASGRECVFALEAAEILEKSGISASVVNVRFLKPFDAERLRKDAENKIIVTVEDSLIPGGLASLADSALVGRACRILHFGWRNVPPHGEIPLLREQAGFTPEAAAEAVRKMLRA